MIAALELASRRARAAVLREGALEALLEVPTPAGSEALAAALARLPEGVRELRLLVSGPELLARSHLVLEGTPERQERQIALELAGDLGSEPLCSGHGISDGWPDGELRACSLTVRAATVQAWRALAAATGCRLEAVSHPAVGLCEAWRAAGGTGDACLLDVGGAQSHLALVARGRLLALRTLPQGMDAAAAAIAGSDDPEAGRARLAALRPDGDAEALAAVRRQAEQVALAVLNALKLLKAQLRLPDWQPAALWLAGAGAQAPGVIEALAERLGLPVRVLNPFAAVRAERRDLLAAHAALPSPWAAVLGAARAPALPLDALQGERQQRRQWWLATGSLRLAAALAAASLLATVLWQEGRLASAAARLAALGAGSGASAHAELAELAARRDRAREQLRWLERQRRAPRAAHELLAAVARLQDPEDCPVVLSELRLERQAGGLAVELQGLAAAGARRNPGEVVTQFGERLRAAYPPIASLRERPVPAQLQRQPFHLTLQLPDP